MNQQQQQQHDKAMQMRKTKRHESWCSQHVDGICLKSTRWHAGRHKWSPPVVSETLIVYNGYPDVKGRGINQRRT